MLLGMAKPSPRFMPFISLFIGPHHHRRKVAAISQCHVDFVCALDHVKVREDVTIWSNNETGAFALDRPKVVWVTPLTVFIRRPLEEQVVEWRTLASVVF